MPSGCHPRRHSALRPAFRNSRVLEWRALLIRMEQAVACPTILHRTRQPQEGRRYSSLLLVNDVAKLGVDHIFFGLLTARLVTPRVCAPRLSVARRSALRA